VIRHRKPLPASIDITDLVAQRVYGWMYSQGVEGDVTATVETP
jgi:hypothetical protein